MQNTDVLLAKIEETKAKFIDLRWNCLDGKDKHITLPSSCVDEIFLQFYQSLLLKPDVSTLILDPFLHDQTLMVRCETADSPRVIAKRAADYLTATNIADSASFALELEFFLFDDVRWKTGLDEAFYKVNAESAPWNSDKIVAGGNIGHRCAAKEAN